MNDDIIMFDFTDNDEIEMERREFEPLPAGKYPFEIVTYDKSRYDKAGGKIPQGCKVATFHFKLDASSVNRGEVTVKENYYLIGGKGFEWAPAKLRGLLEGVGLMDKDDTRIRLDCDKLVGKSGVLNLSLDPDKNDKTKLYNHVKSFVPKPKEEGDYDF